MRFEFIIVCIMFGIVAAVIAYFAKVIEKKADISLVVGGKLQDAINKFAAVAYYFGERDRAVDRVTPINRTRIIEWIPCEERLPEEDGYYLVTHQWQIFKDEYEINIDEYRHGEWVETPRSCMTVAWMPLLEPYDGERKDDE